MIDYNKTFSDYLTSFNKYALEVLRSSRFENRYSSGLETMLDAMSYSLENGGKRIRPILTLEFCRIFSGDYKKALPSALAVEMIHTYSLIHDDLPCMDNDDYRRGKPSNHIVYGYANALLAGDALLTLAFEILSDCELDAEKRCRSITELSKAAGCSGMIAGQVMDLENEGKNVSVDIIRSTDKLKTGEMLKAAGVLGCIAGGADEEKIKSAEEYCNNIGIAFQIMDDILDVTSDSETLGKPVGSDNANKKSTYVSLLGIEECKRTVKSLTDRAVAAINCFGDNSTFLKKLAVELSDRTK